MRTSAESAWTGSPVPAADFARLVATDLNLLVPLLALLEERSVTSAAARVAMTQPAMSHALRRMRRLLGDELLVRQGSGMLLTPRALELVTPLRRALRHTADVLGSRRFDPSTDRRVVTLAMTSGTALGLAGTLTKLLMDRAPHVVLRLRTMPLPAPPSDSVFTHEGADVMLLPKAFDSPHPREHLYDDEWVVITTSSAPQVPVTELIEALPHVVFDAPPYRVRPYEVLDSHRVRYEVRARVSDPLLIPHVVAGSGGIAFHRHRVVSQLTSSLDLRLHEFPLPIERLGIDLVWNPWLTDQDLRGWLGAIIREAASATGVA